MKKNRKVWFLKGDEMNLQIRKMKLTAILLFIFFASFGNSFSQIKLTVKFNQTEIRDVIQTIEEKTDYIFLYKDKIFDFSQKVTADFDNASFEEVLKNFCDKTNTSYEIRDRQIILNERDLNSVLRVQQAQKKEIIGKVIDSSGESIPGVSIVAKGTTNGTISDIDGNFSLSNLSSDDVLVFSFVGMIKQEIAVGNQSTFTVTMVVDAVGIDEVVVIGYGTIRKKDLTGSVAAVNVKDAYVAPAASLDQALQGRAAGVQVTSISGEPGSAATIRIRGGNSISAGNEPLYVIDGFIGGGDLSSLNSNDIESIQILKDASSTAIYGARGANGVILVTTKKGKAGKVVVNFKSSIGVQQLPQQIDVQTGSEFAAWINSQASNQSNLPFDLNNLPGEETNWQSVLIHDAPTTDNQLSVSGGNENTQYYTSVGYLSQQGIIKNSGFDRYSLRTTVDTRLSKVFKTGVNLSLSRTHSDNNTTNFTSLMRADPLKPVYEADGTTYTSNETYGVGNATGENLAATNALLLDETGKNRALINTYVQAELGKFIWKSTFGGDFGFNRTNTFTPSTLPSNIVAGLLASASIVQNSYSTLLNENTLNYSAKFGNHNISALGGITFQKNTSENTTQTGSQIPSDGVGVYAMNLAPSTNISMNSGYSEYSVFSLLARVNYSYLGKYIATATVRRDGSSRLGINNKFATFPSVGLGWNISEEPFLKNFTKLDILKLRTTYGVTGNSGVTPFSTLATVSLAGGNSIIDGVLTKGTSQGSLATPDLKWETTAQYDLGLEVSFLKGRVSSELDLYYKKTSNLILDADVPLITGFSTTIQNVGSLENRGVDFSLTVVPIQTKDFRFSTKIDISTYKNKVLSLGIKPFIQTSNLGAPANDENARLIVGQPVGTFWGYIYDGVDAATGEIKYKDIAGTEGVAGIDGTLGGPDGVINTNDKTIIGHANPDYYGGIHLDFQYKNFDLTTFFPFTVGGQNYNTQILQATEVTTNSFAYLRDRMWSVANPDNALVPKAGSTLWNKSNSLFIQDASYFRLGTLQIGYTLPSNLIKGITNCRFYFTGTNLFLIKAKDYLGFDPDVSSFGTDNVKRGFDNVAYPNNRSLLIGLDISF